MGDFEKRVIVERVDLGTVFRFHTILRAVTASMAPPRLMLGLLMVVIFMTAGREWDRFATPAVSPLGLLAGPCSEAEHAVARAILQDAMRRFGNGEREPDLATPGATQSRAVLRHLRAEVERRAAEGASTDAAALARTIATIEAVRPRGTFEATVLTVAASLKQMVRSALLIDPPAVAGRSAGDLFLRVPSALWRHHRWFAVVFLALTVVVAAIGGGALCRMSACFAADGRRLRLREAVDFGLGACWRLMGALMLPLLVIGFVAAIVMLLGLTARAPWALRLIGGLAYGPALMFGGLLAFLILGLLLSWWLLLPAIACENCDAADAQQRAYAYLINRPLHLVGYGVVAIVGLALGYLVLGLLLSTALNITSALFELSGGKSVGGLGGFGVFDMAPRAPAVGAESTWERWTVGLITFWQTLAAALLPAWVLSYSCAAATRVYLLLREACDGQPPEEIWHPGMVPGTTARDPQEAGQTVPSEPADD